MSSNKSRKNSSVKRKKANYIVVEKFKRNILGVDTRLYKIKLNEGFQCTKKLTLKKMVNPITKTLKNFPILSMESIDCIEKL